MDKMVGLNFSLFQVEMTEVPVLELFDTNDIIYLTPDATDMLEELDKDKVYVIGGIVDESVIKVGLRWINSG